MPFVMARTNVPVSKEQELEIKPRFGKVIGLVPGKSEEYLLMGIEDNCRMWLRGDNAPMVYIEAAIFGNEQHYGYDRLTAGITRIYNEVLDIPPENVYIKYDDISSWGVRGMFIEGRR